VKSSLRELRDARVLTQAEVAAKVNLSVRQYSLLERGRHLPSIGVLRRLAEFFEVDAVELRDDLAKQRV
jgi:transcriptional regulator with XRE-family HTH domain